MMTWQNQRNGNNGDKNLNHSGSYNHQSFGNSGAVVQASGNEAFKLYQPTAAATSKAVFPSNNDITSVVSDTSSGCESDEFHQNYSGVPTLLLQQQQQQQQKASISLIEEDGSFKLFAKEGYMQDIDDPKTKEQNALYRLSAVIDTLENVATSIDQLPPIKHFQIVDETACRGRSLALSKNLANGLIRVFDSYSTTLRKQSKKQPPQVENRLFHRMENCQHQSYYGKGQPLLIPRENTISIPNSSTDSTISTDKCTTNAGWSLGVVDKGKIVQSVPSSSSTLATGATASISATKQKLSNCDSSHHNSSPVLLLPKAEASSANIMKRSTSDGSCSSISTNTSSLSATTSTVTADSHSIILQGLDAVKNMTTTRPFSAAPVTMGATCTLSTSTSPTEQKKKKKLKLEIIRTRVNSECIALLHGVKGAQVFEEIVFHRMSISENVLKEVLEDNPTLEHLTIRKCEVSIGAVKYLCDYLKDSNVCSLSALDWMQNTFQTNLNHHHQQHNIFLSTAARSQQQQLQLQLQLQLNGSAVGGVNGISGVQNHHHHNRHQDEEEQATTLLVDAIQNNKTLIHFGFAYLKDRFTETMICRVLNGLYNHPTIQHLILDHTICGNGALKVLKHVFSAPKCQITKLHISKAVPYHGELRLNLRLLLEGIHSNKKLTHLALPSNFLCNNDFVKVMKAIYHSTNEVDAFCPNLQHLDLSCNEISKLDLSSLHNADDVSSNSNLPSYRRNKFHCLDLTGNPLLHSATDQDRMSLMQLLAMYPSIMNIGSMERMKNARGHASSQNRYSRGFHDHSPFAARGCSSSKEVASTHLCTKQSKMLLKYNRVMVEVAQTNGTPSTYESFSSVPPTDSTKKDSQSSCSDVPMCAWPMILENIEKSKADDEKFNEIINERKRACQANILFSVMTSPGFLGTYGGRGLNMIPSKDEGTDECTPPPSKRCKVSPS